MKGMLPGPGHITSSPSIPCWLDQYHIMNPSILVGVGALDISPHYILWNVAGEEVIKNIISWSLRWLLNVGSFIAGYEAFAMVTTFRVFKAVFGNGERVCRIHHANVDISNSQGQNPLKVYWLLSLKGQSLYMYNLPYVYTYPVSDIRCITLVLMHILIQSPSPYKSSFSYKTSDDAETHDPSTHSTVTG